MFKSLGVPSKGAPAALKDIEILPNDDDVSTVTLHGDAKLAAETKGIGKVLISLSHCKDIVSFLQPAKPDGAPTSSDD